MARFLTTHATGQDKNVTQQKRERPEDYFSDWKAREALAEGMIPLVGKLYRHNNVKTFIYGRSLVGQSVLTLMKSHRFVRQVEKNELSEFETYPLMKALAELDLGPAHIDIGRLAVEYMAAGSGESAAQFLQTKLSDLIGSKEQPLAQPQDVVLYGFGRIGRLLARLLIEKVGAGDALRLRAIVVRKGGDNDLLKRTSLLRRDSVHGSFKGTIRIDEEHGSFVANGNEIKVIYANGSDQIDYTASPEVVSSDFVGSRHACIFDAQSTIANGKNVVLYYWYDNEFGYACQVSRVLEQMAGVRYPVYPSA